MGNEEKIIKLLEEIRDRQIANRKRVVVIASIAVVIVVLFMVFGR